MEQINAWLAKAKNGLLTSKEVLDVAEKIQKLQFENDEELYALLLILGLSGATKWRDLVESFLNAPQESIVPGIVFKILFRYWDDSSAVEEPAFKKMKNLVIGFPFDEYEYFLLNSLKLFTRPLYSLEDLIMEVKYGALTPQEVSHVAENIKKAKTGDGTDLYALLFILGRSRATDYRELVEFFLHDPADPMVSGIALKVLVQDWEEGAQRYLNVIKTFINKVSWDPFGDARLAALQCVGGFLRKNPDKDLLQLLLDLYEGSVSSGEDSKEVIFEALATAVGKDLDEIIACKREGPEGVLFDQPFVLEVLTQSKHLIKGLTSCSSP